MLEKENAPIQDEKLNQTTNLEDFTTMDENLDSSTSAEESAIIVSEEPVAEATESVPEIPVEVPEISEAPAEEEEEEEHEEQEEQEEEDQTTPADTDIIEPSETISEISEEETPVAQEIISEEVPVEETIPEEETPVAQEIISEEVPVDETIPEEETPVAPEIISEEVPVEATILAGESTDTDEESEEDENEEDGSVKLTEMSKAELVEFLENLVNTTPVEEIKVDVDKIKSLFYRKYRAEVELMRKAFIDEGGDPAQFAYEPDPLEERLKQSLGLYKRLKSEIQEAQEKEKLINLARKYEIIDKIKELINGQESMNRTFNEFKTLQNEWHEIGTVPQTEIKNLWENYHHNVEQFYDFIKINKELRDLDQKKNLDAKISICERAEELIAEPSIVKAFSTLQSLHDEWREAGPVAPEKREEVWTRFKLVTATINKNHQDYFQTLKDEQNANLQAKMALCEKAEELANANPVDAKEWEDKTNELTEVQKIWRTIGFATKKDNTRIFEQFRAACDLFFNKKREYYKDYKDNQTENLQLKTDLCIQAEAIKASSDWKNATDELIQLQKKWKEIGPVPKKYSDLIWKRFRAACNEFFERKNSHFESIDSVHDENLRLKRELIQKVKDFVANENVEETIQALKIFQSEWSSIGHVPMKLKDKIQSDFRDVINEKFAAIKVDESKRNVMMFKQKMEHMNQHTTPNKKNRQVYGEREKILDKIRQLESDIVVLDNNIGFFAKTKNAETLINDVKKKIEKAKQQIITEKQKLDVLNKFE